MKFNKIVDLDFLKEMGKGTMVEHLGIEFTHIGEDFLEATMPVDDRTKQPMGLLHGGANVVLAETLGSVASSLMVDQKTHYCVGLEINANHLKAITSGTVRGVTKAIHVGKKTQVWEIKIYSEKEELSCISRITIAVLEKK
jgi:1,4-dihydroxy-2-naphthoyl-CoA hydrolase